MSRVLTTVSILLVPALALALASGCMGQPPPKTPSFTFVDVQEGVPIETETEDETYSTNKKHVCDELGCFDRTVPSYDATRPRTTITYGDRKLSFADLTFLADPSVKKSKLELDELTARCKGARVPSIFGYVLLSGGLAVASGGYSNEIKPVLYAGAAITGAGILAFGLARFAFGGSACAPARELYEELNGQLSSLDLDREDVTYWRTDEITQLVRTFNDRHTRGTARASKPASDDATED